MSGITIALIFVIVILSFFFWREWEEGKMWFEIAQTYKTELLDIKEENRMLKEQLLAERNMH